ncbi:hypothetical protein HDU78_009723 [Chytriomyces hyalinus]|nr:hypothetical protein HDU78_009723 [Chytriomyces hyalinus]
MLTLSHIHPPGLDPSCAITTTLVDPASECVVRIGETKSGAQFVAVDSPLLLATHRDTATVRAARVSKTRTKLALVLGTASVHILDISSKERASLLFEVSHQLRQNKKSSHAILGVEWTSFHESSEFFIVSNDGVDFYSFSKSRKTFALRRTMPMHIAWYIYSSKHSLLALYTGSTVISFLHVSSPLGVVSDLPSLSIDAAAGFMGNTNMASSQSSSATGFGSSFARFISAGMGSSNSSSALIQKRQVALFQVYDRLFFSYFRQSDRTLLLYRITKAEITLSHECDLNSPNESRHNSNNQNISISVSDNLIVAHNHSLGLISVFDLKDPAFHDADGDELVVWGFRVDPIVRVVLPDRLDESRNILLEDEDVSDVSQEHASKLFNHDHDWTHHLSELCGDAETQFVFPRYIVASSLLNQFRSTEANSNHQLNRLCVLELKINLNQVLSHLKETRGFKGESAAWILQFLLRRRGEVSSEITQLVLPLVYDVVNAYCTQPESVGMDSVGEVFDLLHKTRFLRDGVSSNQLSAPDIEDTESSASPDELTENSDQLIASSLARPKFGSKRISAHDFVARIFVPLASSDSVKSRRLLAACIQRYLLSKLQFNAKSFTPSTRAQSVSKPFSTSVAAPSQTDPTFLLATLYLSINESNQIHSLVHAGVIPNSKHLATLLIKSHITERTNQRTSLRTSTPTKSTRTQSARDFQLGIQMLHQCDSGFQDILLHAHISAGNIFEALEYALEKAVPLTPYVSVFMEAALATRNKTLFLNVYRVFDERGLISRHSRDDGMDSDEGEGGSAPFGTARYYSVFREYWEESLVMQGM